MAYITDHGRVNVTKDSSKKSFLTAEVLEHVHRTEWMLFEMLDSVAIDYKR